MQAPRPRLRSAMRGRFVLPTFARTTLLGCYELLRVSEAARAILAGGRGKRPVGKVLIRPSVTMRIQKGAHLNFCTSRKIYQENRFRMNALYWEIAGFRSNRTRVYKS